jgi:hypothetical protein
VIPLFFQFKASLIKINTTANVHIKVTSRRVRATIVAVEKHQPLRASYAHAPCHTAICGTSGCTIFFTLPHKRTIFGQNLLKIKCMFRFSLQLLPEIFFNPKIIQQNTIINVHRPTRKAPIDLVRL